MIEMDADIVIRFKLHMRLKYTFVIDAKFEKILR